MLSVSCQPATGEAGPPSLLFRKADLGQFTECTFGYDVTPDGSRFLVVTPVDRPAAPSTVVVLNWLEALKRKVPRSARWPSALLPT